MKALAIAQQDTSFHQETNSTEQFGVRHGGVNDPGGLFVDPTSETFHGNSMYVDTTQSESGTTTEDNQEEFAGRKFYSVE